MRPGSLSFIATLLTAAALVLWAAVITSMFEPAPDHDMDVVMSLAITDSIISAMIWFVKGIRVRSDERELQQMKNMSMALRTIAEFTRDGARAATGPLLRLVEDAEGRRAKSPR